MSQNNDTSKNRKWKQLSERERYKIETLLKEKLTTQEIAERMGRNRHTIEREIARCANKGRGLKIANDHKLVC